MFIVIVKLGKSQMLASWNMEVSKWVCVFSTFNFSVFSHSRMHFPCYHKPCLHFPFQKLLLLILEQNLQSYIELSAFHPPQITTFILILPRTEEACFLNIALVNNTESNFFLTKEFSCTKRQWIQTLLPLKKIRKGIKRCWIHNPLSVEGSASMTLKGFLLGEVIGCFWFL